MERRKVVEENGILGILAEKLLQVDAGLVELAGGEELVGAVADWCIIPQDIYSFSNCSASSLVIPMIDATDVGISLSCVACSNLAILVRVLLML